MRYLKRTEINSIVDEYDIVIGWGTGPILRMNYKTSYFHMDFLIDGTGKNIGEKIKGMEIKSSDSLLSLRGKILIIIYAIYESEILKQIEKYDIGQIDVIIYSLLDVKLKNGCMVPQHNGKSCEDILLLSLINQLQLDSVSFLEIGVCHPVMRNNTYILHEQFGENDGYKGVVVEANPICWPLIQEYRKNDILVKAGIVPNNYDGEETIKFYMFPRLLGHSTFSKDIARDTIKDGYECEELMIPVKKLDTILNDYFDKEPDILGIDAEGLDEEILKNWDSEKYPIKMVIAETSNDIDMSIHRAMEEKGYCVYAETIENTIWIYKKYNLFT